MSDINRILQTVPSVTKLKSTNIPDLKKFKLEYKTRETFVNSSITGNSAGSKSQREAYLGIPQESDFITPVIWGSLLYQTQRQQRNLRDGTAQEQASPLAVAPDIDEDNFTTEWILDRIEQLTSGSIQLDSTSNLKEYHEHISKAAQEVKLSSESLNEAIPALFGIILAGQKLLYQSRTQEQKCTDALRILDTRILAAWAVEQYRLGTADDAYIPTIKNKLKDLHVLLDDIMNYYEKKLWKDFISNGWDEEKLLAARSDIDDEKLTWLETHVKPLAKQLKYNRSIGKADSKKRIAEEPLENPSKKQKRDLREDIERQKSKEKTPTRKPDKKGKSSSSSSDKRKERLERLKDELKKNPPTKEDLSLHCYQEDGVDKCSNCHKPGHTSRHCFDRCNWCVEKFGKDACDKENKGNHHHKNCDYRPMNWGAKKVDTHKGADQACKLTDKRLLKFKWKDTNKKVKVLTSDMATAALPEGSTYRATATNGSYSVTVLATMDTGANTEAIPNSHAIQLGKLLDTPLESYPDAHLITLGNEEKVLVRQYLKIPAVTVQIPRDEGGYDPLTLKDVTFDVLPERHSTPVDSINLIVGHVVLEGLGLDLNTTLREAVRRNNGSFDVAALLEEHPVRQALRDHSVRVNKSTSLEALVFTSDDEEESIHVSFDGE